MTTPSSSVSSEPSGSNEATLRSVIIAVATAQFLLPFMISGVNPLLPMIGDELNASAMELGLVSGVYALSLAIFHLISGRIGDMIGRRKLFLVGLSIFLVMSAITPFAPNIIVFLAFRFVHAVGTAMMNTSALAILIACAPPHMRGRVLGIASIGVFAGISCGPAIGGFIGTTLGWKYLFISVLPLGLIAWLLMAFTVKGDWTSNPDKPFDWKGASLFTLGISAVTAGATWILAGPWAIGLVVAGLVLMGLFVWSQSGRAYPILDVNFVGHNLTFMINLFISLLTQSSAFGLLFYFSLYLQEIQHLNLLQTGLVLSVQPVAQLLLSPWTGRLADRKGAVRVATVGLLFIGLGLYMSSRLGATSALWEVPLAQIWIGLGFAFFAAPNTSSIMGSVDHAHLSQASGLVGTTRTMGGLFSMVIVSVTINLYLGHASLNASTSGAFLEAMQMDLNLFGLLNIIAVACSMWQIWRTRKKHVANPSS